MKRYYTPSGNVPNLYENILKQSHVLIAGTTGSGKSVAINGIIYTLLYYFPNEKNIVLIDPKKVELIQFTSVPHCLKYASEPEDMIKTLNDCLYNIELRYKQMQKKQIKKYDGSDVYIVIDELADLLTTEKRKILPILQRIAQIGRAARFHIIAGTQCTIREVIDTKIKVNFDARLALRTRSAQDSRNIIDRNGCEKLPRYGKGIYITPEHDTIVNIPMIPDYEINRVINHWKKQKKRLF